MSEKVSYWEEKHEQMISFFFCQLGPNFTFTFTLPNTYSFCSLVILLIGSVCISFLGLVRLSRDQGRNTLRNRIEVTWPFRFVSTTTLGSTAAPDCRTGRSIGRKRASAASFTPLGRDYRKCLLKDSISLIWIVDYLYFRSQLLLQSILL